MPFYGGSIGAGYNAALNDISARDRSDQEVARSKQLQRMADEAMEQQRADRAKGSRYEQNVANYLGTLAPPPVNPQQPPGGPPGQSSQPAPQMRPQQCRRQQQPGLGSGIPPAPMPQAGPPPNPGVPMPQARPQPGPQPVPMPTGGAPAPQAPPMGMTSQPNPPMAPPQGQPQQPAQPQGQQATPTVQGLIAALKDQGVPQDQWMGTLERFKLVFDQANREELADLKHKHEQVLAETARYKEKLAEIAQGNTERRIDISEKNSDTQSRRTDALISGMNRREDRLSAAAVAKGGGPAKADPLANLPPEKDKELRIQAWNYINGKGLPYRKGSGGGADRNDSVMAMASKISNELDMPPQELAGKSASFKADAMSFGNLSKKADVIEAQLQSFHNNLDTWDTLAKGQGLKLGSTGSKQLASTLGKINFTGVKTLDEFKMRIQQEVNDPAAVAVLTAASAAAFDYARIMSSQGQSAGQITDSARAEAQRLVSSAYSDKSRAALIATLDSDTAGQIKGLIDQKDKVYGRLTGKGVAKPASGGGIPQGWSVKERP